MENNIEHKKVIKCLKSFLTGKKYHNIDENKSFEYFKQCIRILNDIKERKIQLNQDLENIIEETETECSKYLTNAIESTIEKPIMRVTNTNDNENELFEIIETGSIDKLRSYNYGDVNFSISNEVGLTPLHVAIKYGDTTFLKHAFKLGGSVDQTNQYGHTLLEYACLEKDPNMINFLLKYGADMKKHLLFREGKKYFNNGKQIDILLLEKIIMDKVGNDELKYLDFLYNYFDKNENIELEYADSTNATMSKSKIPIKIFIQKLDTFLDMIDARDTYINIIQEELSYDLSFKLGCPTNKIEILLYNLVPFIDYKDNLRLNWLISLEIKYFILKILRNKVKINTKQLKAELEELLYNSYIKDEIVPDGLIQTLVLQWIYKIKV